jgi:cell division protein FtsN
MSEVIHLRMSRKRAILTVVCMAGAGLLLFAAGLATGLLWASLAEQTRVLPAVTIAQSASIAPAVSASAAHQPSSGEGETATENAPLLPVSMPTLIAVPLASPPTPAAPTASATAAPESTKLKITTPSTFIADQPKDEVTEGISLEIRVCSFTSQSSARSMVDDLATLGYHANIVHAAGAHGRDWYVVKLGPYAAWDTASSIASHIAIAENVKPMVEPMR